MRVLASELREGDNQRGVTATTSSITFEPRAPAERVRRAHDGGDLKTAGWT